MSLRLLGLWIIVLLAGCITEKGASQFFGIKCDSAMKEACSQKVKSLLLDNSFYEVNGPNGVYQLNGVTYQVFFRNRESAKSPCNPKSYNNCIVSAFRYDNTSSELVVMLREVGEEDEPSNDAKKLFARLMDSTEAQFGHGSIRYLGNDFEFGVEASK
ncbi:MAG TPA: hypothetical protein VFK88_03685 [Gallionella sp.]|nr:hypothetical protein [Gallionella sp.]